MAIVESGVVCPKSAQVNKASVNRQCFYQIQLVREKQERKYYQRCLPEIIFFLYAAGKNLVDITLKPFIVRSTCLTYYVHNTSVCDDLAHNPEAEDLVSVTVVKVVVVVDGGWKWCWCWRWCWWLCSNVPWWLGDDGMVHDEKVKVVVNGDGNGDCDKRSVVAC